MSRTYSQTTVRPHGGVRPTSQPQESSGTIRRWLTRLWGAVILSGVVAALIKGGMLLSEKPVEQVIIEGEFAYVSREEVAAQVYESLDTTFIKIDLNQMQRHLSGEPWIDRVSVTRHWPDTLVVRVIEQRPIARWGDDGFVNMRGEIVRPESVAGLEQLPLLAGPDDMAMALMTRYQALSTLLREQGLSIREVRLDKTLSWSMVLNDGLAVAIGRGQVMEKISRFLTVYRAEIKARINEVARIDVRYSNGVAVSWKNKA